MSSSSSKRRKNHVYFFRHCVRSTRNNVKFYNDTNIDSSAKQYSAGDFTASPMPNWNTPEMWCTQHGMTLIQQIAKYIVKNTILQSNNNSKNPTSPKVKIQIVSDASQRDVDTSFAIYEGIRSSTNAFSNGNISIIGLDDVQYDPNLFKPLDNNFCPKPYTRNQLVKDIQNRLDKVPPPESNLDNVLKILENLGGIGKAGSLLDIDNYNTKDDPFPLSSYTPKIKLQGPINIVKLYAQIMFFSRAGGVTPPFLPHATPEQVYKSIAWIHWMKSILDVDNVDSATRGVVMAQGILEALVNGHYWNGMDSLVDTRSSTPTIKEEEEEEEYDITNIVFFVGHDSNLNQIATAFGLRWNLDVPYYNGNKDDNIDYTEYIPTPPGSALHFEYDWNSEALEMSYLYPVFPLGDDDKEVRFETTAVNFNPPLDNMDGKIRISKLRQKSTLVIPTTTTTNKSNKGPMTETVVSSASLTVLQQRIDQTLERWPQAMDCYEKARNQSSHSSLLLLSSEQSLGQRQVVGDDNERSTIPSFVKNVLSVALLVNLGLVVMFLWKGSRRVGRQRGGGGKVE